MMPNMTAAPKDIEGDKALRLFIIFISCLTAIRVVLLMISDLNIGPDEAQYWWWSQSFEFGYFSKPPMIAWLIRATTSVFGDAEWAVRLGSPLVSAATSIMIFFVARALYDSRTALWAGVLWATLPVMMISAGIISTDVPLLFFWSAALFGLVRLCKTEGASLGWAAFTGAMIGLGMMSKYAMIYFPLALGLSFVLSTFARKAMKPLPLLIMGGVAFVFFLPNILWNAANDFQTLSHTQSNANLKGDLYNLDELAEFLISQAGIVGPILFVFLVWGLVRLKKKNVLAGDEKSRDMMLIAFLTPPLLIISIQAFLSRANANWAMTAYPAVIILLTAWMLRARQMRWMKAAIGLHIVLAAIVFAVATNFTLADKLGLQNEVKRVRGWPAQAADILSKSEGYDVLLVDDRELMGNLLYYLRDSDKEIYALDVLGGYIDHHYEAFNMYQRGSTDKALLVMKYPKYLYAYVEFSNRDVIAISELDLGVKCLRQYTLVALSGYDSTKTQDDIPPPPPGTNRRNGDCKPF